MNAFKDYSQYYDLLYRDKDYAAETAYIHNLIQEQNPGAKTILNLGCGTGKHDILLAELGYEIFAVDLSKTMIDIAKQNIDNTNVQFEVMDIRSIEIDQKFDAVISLFHVMSYQTEDTDLQQAFSSAKKHLKNDGVFIFDCWYGPGVVSDPPEKRLKEVENEHMKIVRKTTPIIHEKRNVVEVVFDVNVTTKKDGISNQFEEVHPMRYLFPEDVINTAEKVDLKLVESYQWLTQQTPDNNWYTVNILK